MRVRKILESSLPGALQKFRHVEPKGCIFACSHIHAGEDSPDLLFEKKEKKNALVCSHVYAHSYFTELQRGGWPVTSHPLDHWS